jgi:membrane protein implicated in regulation of membrane protease activity
MKRHIVQLLSYVMVAVFAVVLTARWVKSALREARAELQQAAHDFCGHRADALRDRQKALSQLQQALACDRK